MILVGSGPKELGAARLLYRRQRVTRERHGAVVGRVAPSHWGRAPVMRDPRHVIKKLPRRAEDGFCLPVS
jgi:hypothetical protein